MGYCKHQWKDRSDVLREVFSFDRDRREHVFRVCERCLKIDESADEESGLLIPLTLHGAHAA